MKHNLKITIVLIAMFIITQIIGLAVVNVYTPKKEIVYNSTTGEYQNITTGPELPYGTQPPELQPQQSLSTIIVSMVIAIVLIFILMKFKATTFLRLWFFFVVILAIGITLNARLLNFTPYSAIISFLIASVLSYFKIFKRDVRIHNATELMIYPGLASVFIPILVDEKGFLFNLVSKISLSFANSISGFLAIWPVIILLILISIYDAWAVWHSKIMQKMAKFQINELKFFAGFFVPYMSKEMREKLKQSKISKKSKEKNVKVSLAILGGGDVVFPIITSGVVMRTLGWVPALFVVAGATIALIYLFMVSEKKKFYPAMPFITTGIFLGLILAWILGFI
jgi:presenilin-like A22 family membrane protease